MKPTIAVEVTARDKTESGFRSAERRGAAFSRRTSAFARESGLSKIGKQMDGLAKLRGLSFSFDAAGRSLSSIGSGAQAAAGGFAQATERALLFGQVGSGALGLVARSAGVVVGSVAGVTATIIGATVAAYKFGEKWAKIGAEVDRTARTVGVSGAFLQSTRAAGERFGVTPDETTGAIDAFGSTLYDAKTGGNNLALGVLNQLGVKLKATADGGIDTEAALMDLADAIARQKDPQVQKKLAGIFGLSSMLPALRQGSAVLKAEGADYMASGSAFTEAETAKATETTRQAVRLRQHLTNVEQSAGVAAMNVTEAGAKHGVDFLHKPAETTRDTVKQTSDAVDNLIGEPLRNLGKALGGALGFAKRLEHQESRGRQLDRKGRPLTSSAGAVGVMQMLPETAQKTARAHGIKWDARKFRYDAEYNRNLGQLHAEDLLKQFGGNEVLAAAAYNAGAGRLTGYRQPNGSWYRGWLERFGDPRKGEISDADFARKIPFAETRDYVEKTVLRHRATGAAAEAATPDRGPAGGRGRPTEGGRAPTAPPAKAQVEIVLRNAPAGTTSRVSAERGVDVDMRVARGMEGP